MQKITSLFYHQIIKSMTTIITFIAVLITSLLSCLVLVGGFLTLMKLTNSDRQLRSSTLEFQQLADQHKSLNHDTTRLNFVQDGLRVKKHATSHRRAMIDSSFQQGNNSSVTRSSQHQHNQGVGLLHRAKQIDSQKRTTKRADN